MKSNSYYFSHDYNSANDTKILFLRHQLGMEGYGIYWFLIEQLANAGGKLPLELIPVLAMQMQTTDVKVNGVVHNFDLFTIASGEFYSERLQNHLALRQNLSEKGKLGAANRWKNGEANGVAIGEGNAKERKEKESKVKETKVKVSKQTLFSETEFLDIDKFKAAFIGSQYEEANFTYYHEVIKNWSDSNGEKKLNWIATAKNWMARDLKEGKFVHINYKPNATGISNNHKPNFSEREWDALRNLH
jgi:hypothetical protein